MKYGILTKATKNGPASVTTLRGSMEQTTAGNLVQTLNGRTSLIKKGSWVIIDQDIKKEKAKAQKDRVAATAAFMKALTPSKELAAVIGETALPRTEVVKKFWAFIKKNGLQDVKNKRMINIGDHELTKPLHKGRQMSMFDMTKMLSKHLK